MSRSGRADPRRRGRRAAGAEDEAEEQAEEQARPDEGASDPWWEDGQPRGPRRVVGGLAARTRRGPFGTTWWSRRFLEALESVLVGGRVERGRAYARRGQVLDLAVHPGVVEATVQGSREDPYTVRLRMEVVPEEDWDRVVRALGARAGHAAPMLAGELPPEVEEVFESEGASLLPAPHARLVTECTCPDWENPCKHVAAVCYLLAEGFDRDPFLLLAWRGRAKEQVLGELRTVRQTHVATATAGPEVGTETDTPSPEDPGATGPAGADDPIERFWTAGPELGHVRVRPDESPVPAAVLRLAPRGLVSVRGGDLADALAPLYRRVAAAAAARARR